MFILFYAPLSNNNNKPKNAVYFICNNNPHRLKYSKQSIMINYIISLLRVCNTHSSWYKMTLFGCFKITYVMVITFVRFIRAPPCINFIKEINWKKLELKHYNEHFNITLMEIDKGLRLGSVWKRDCSKSISFERWPASPALTIDYHAFDTNR